MRGIIAEFGGRYMLWSETWDSPSTTLMTRGEFYEFVLLNHGYDALKDLDERMKRVDKTGSSSRMGTGKESLLEYNRAGPKESHVKTEAEMVEMFGGFTVAHWEGESSARDLTKPLEMYDLGQPNLGIPIKEVLCINGGVALVTFSLPGHSEEIPILIRAEDGKVLNEGYKYMYVRNIKASAD